MTEALQVAEVFARRLRQLREQRRWSQERLAQRAAELGLEIDRAAIVKIERAADPGRTGKAKPRRVTIEEAVGLAAALGVPLLSLLLPDDELAIAPGVTLDAGLAGAWMIGFVPLRREDASPYSAAKLPTPIVALGLTGMASGVIEGIFAQMESPHPDDVEALSAFIEKERLMIQDLERMLPGLPEDAQEPTRASLKSKREALDRIENTLSPKKRRKKS